MEDAVLSVGFKSSFKDEFSISFILPKVFPRKYYLRFASVKRPSGLIDVYINGELIGSQDTWYFYRPIVGAEGRVLPVSGTQNFMSWEIDNLTQYGDVEVTLVYRDKGRGSDKGLVVDYVALIPVKE